MAGAVAPASAEWKRASSEHFIIYSEQKTDELEEFSRRLELFDAVVRLGRGMVDRPVGDGNRVTVYVVKDIDAVQRSYGARGSGVAGFYNPSVAGPYALTPARGDGRGPWSLTEDIIFFHEYGHHLLLQDFANPAPGWLVEGFAELVSTVRFESDARVSLGLAANHRGMAVFFRRGIPIETLLKGDYSQLNDYDVYTLYGRSWMLTHYLTFEASRRGQLDKYLAAIATGADPLDAARTVFGDLKQLEKDMEKHARAKQLPYIGVPTASLKISPVKVESLSPGGDAILPLRMQSKRGVSKQTAGPLAARIRKAAASYPADPLVQVTLAEAEHDADQLDAADAAADRALASDPSLIEAMIYKGRVAMKRGKDAEGTAKAAHFKDARNWFLKASARDPEDPEPLSLIYASFEDEKIAPTAFAVQALHRAARLVPQDDSVRLTSVRQYLRDGKLKETRNALLPLSFDPHARKMAEYARELIDLVDRSDPAAALALIDKRKTEDEGKDKDKGKKQDCR